MTDRELLELAAKSIGKKIEWRLMSGGWHDGKTLQFIGPYEGWNPLTNDGDALRLAVKLKLSTQTGSNTSWASSCTPDKTGEPWIGEDHKGDPYAATRRAIVRAAAEIDQLKGK